jgi:hypothetical protein
MSVRQFREAASRTAGPAAVCSDRDLARAVSCGLAEILDCKAVEGYPRLMEVVYVEATSAFHQIHALRVSRGAARNIRAL